MTDFLALRDSTAYSGGFTERSDQVQWLWRTVEAMSLEERELLAACTGGSGSRALRVMGAGDDQRRLPSCNRVVALLVRLRVRLLVARVRATTHCVQQRPVDPYVRIGRDVGRSFA